MNFRKKVPQLNPMGSLEKSDFYRRIILLIATLRKKSNPALSFDTGGPGSPDCPKLPAQPVPEISSSDLGSVRPSLPHAVIFCRVPETLTLS